jgi:hypothetical protein
VAARFRGAGLAAGLAADPAAGLGARGFGADAAGFVAAVLGAAGALAADPDAAALVAGFALGFALGFAAPFTPALALPVAAAFFDAAVLWAGTGCGWEDAPAQENCPSRPSTAAIRPRTNSQIRSASASVPFITWPSTWTATIL